MSASKRNINLPLTNFTSWNPLLWQSQTNRKNAIDAMQNGKKYAVENACQQSRKGKAENEFFFFFVALFEVVGMLSFPYLKEVIEYGHEPEWIDQAFISSGLITFSITTFLAISLFQSVKYDSDTKKACEEFLHITKP